MGMDEKGVGIGFTCRVCVFNILPTAKVILWRGKDLVSSNRLEKPGIEPADPGLQGKLHPLHHGLKSNQPFWKWFERYNAYRLDL